MRTRNVLAAAAVACVLALMSAKALAQQVVRTQEYPGNLLHLVDWVMRSKGFCEKEGLDCRPVTLANGPLAQQAAAAGSVDLIVSSADVMMQAVAKGNDLMILGTDITNNIYSLSASAEMAQAAQGKAYPDNMKVLAGKRIGVTARGSSTEMIAKALLSGAGVPTDNITYVAVGAPATAFAALSAKQVDAIVSWDPIPGLCEATKKCAVFVDLSKGQGPTDLQSMNGGYVVWQARREYVQKNAGVIDRFLRAHAAAVKWLNDPKNFNEAREIAGKGFRLGDDVPNRDHVFEQMVRRMVAQYGTKFDRKAVDGFNSFLVTNKLIEKPVPPATLVYDKAP